MSYKFKRVVDIAIAAPASVALSPVMLAVAVLVLVTSGWPMLIFQERVGAKERPIQVIKFRTMKRNTPIVAKSELDSTLRAFTPIGPSLRRWSLDELPQLVNVLRGDMSLIGPRPALPTQGDLLALRRKHGVTSERPGITGLAQVKGRESLTLATKVRLERLYARHASVRLDLQILLWTAGALLSGRGAY